MTIVPAIDLRGGRVVRLRQGLDRERTVYGDDPARTAREWQAQGAQRLHVVDLDAAFGEAPQLDAIASVIAAVGIPVEVGGGVRGLERARRALDAGADRVIFGSVALSAPEIVRQAVEAWGTAVVVALDVRQGQVAVEGWTRTEAVEPIEMGRRLAGWGVGRVQYTDVQRDGSMEGLHTAPIERLARACGLRVSAGGGVATLADVAALRRLEPLGVDEVIVGRALYEGRFTLAQAREACA